MSSVTLPINKCMDLAFFFVSFDLLCIRKPDHFSHGFPLKDTVPKPIIYDEIGRLCSADGYFQEVFTTQVRKFGNPLLYLWAMKALTYPVSKAYLIVPENMVVNYISFCLSHRIWPLMPCSSAPSVTTSLFRHSKFVV